MAKKETDRQTPFQRFDDLARRIVSVPKKEVEDAQRVARATRSKPRKRSDS
jgi:hypothetical protein